MSRIVVVNKELLEQVARELGLGADVVEKTAYRAVNAVAAKNMTRSRREITKSVNLKTAYVRKRLSLRKANAGHSIAVIEGRERVTRLVTYDAKILTRVAKDAKGDPLRGIPAGRKQGGVAVTVAPGRRKKMPGAFLIPLRAGKVDGGNGMGIFIRTNNRRNISNIIAQEIYTSKGSKKPGRVESGDIRHLYGPSVDQVFRNVIDLIAPDVETELEEALLRQARYEFAKALGKTP